ncbi:MAG: hypothetical protein AABX99_00720, partial [Nanoarchaeota archaeon]
INNIIGHAPGFNFPWVYFNKSGTFNLRFPLKFYSQMNSVSNYLNNGWNFVGITPGFFTDSNGNPQSTFNLSSIEGNCNIVKANFFSGGFNGEWIPVSLGNSVDKSKLFSIIGIKVSNSEGCNLGKVITASGSCTKSSNGNITILDDSENIIRSEIPHCLSSMSHPTQVQTGPVLATPDCGVNSSGSWDIQSYAGLCDNMCTNGVCT